MSGKTLGDILDDFTFSDQRGKGSLAGGKPITIWMPARAKASYDRLQEKSGRRFTRKVREAILELISAAETRIK